MAHEVVRYRCGHVAEQCRCPAPKPTRHLPYFCPNCQPKTAGLPPATVQK